MSKNRQLNNSEIVELKKLYKSLILSGITLERNKRKKVQQILNTWVSSLEEESLSHPIIKIFRTMIIVQKEIGLGQTALLSILLYKAVNKGIISIETIEELFDKNVSTIIIGLNKVYELYNRNAVIESENFRKLLLSFAENLQVILIILAERLDTMRFLSEYSILQQEKIAYEASYLYAPLAHRIGLYGIKTELEDLALKYTAKDTYKEIAKKLNETKRSRDQYIVEFIEPVKKRIKDAGFNFEIKGRTKSIYSIWNKIKKQNTTFENIYDLFAIRIIIDCPFEQEKSECWQVYSIITDMYTPNPKRLRDWLSIPKLNGYESLHITVMGPNGKWVEVQIRTRRMDEIAEKGLAAHWKYKGIQEEQGMDEWLKNIREILENPSLNAIDYMDNFKLDLYNEEVFVFTPKGDLQKLKKGATLLDFAYNIHTNIGNKCVGGIVNGKHVQLKYVLKNGDQVEVLTSSTQKPKIDWLNIVTTSKSKNRIKQTLKEIDYKEAENGKETLLRRLKNWKIEYDEAEIVRLAKKLGYKNISVFYQAITNERINLSEVRTLLSEPEQRENTEQRSAENYSLQTELERITSSSSSDVLVIDQNLKNINYSLAKCCNPIYGDDVFGFVTVNGGIKIHRKNCPNAPQMISRFGYRIVEARWSGKSGQQYPITLRIVGHDDIGIVTNITSVISKELNINMRSISVDSNDGLFQGSISIQINDLNALELLIKKIKNIKGVKQVTRE
ncbi:MAG: bifunctional (p)ppGpp synthetase/guanosine-3',5'-bis(diphosphate) 3'-pyrophosphohydrolase [Paludibacteraceae bacterium]|nr:bifunctional (p)ppGpp synthetase/guanosine-3',5'-bis(diphosphate) 3'-pyrophosphohydrolase [Paludibacteraceae bacterium]